MNNGNDSINDSINDNRNERILRMFKSLSKKVDEDQDRRERIIKCSRDITAQSKKMIFALHRLSNNPVHEREKKLKDIEKTFIIEILSMFKSKIFSEYQHFQQQDERLNMQERFNKFCYAGLEEFLEAYSFYIFLIDRSLISLNDFQSLLTLDGHVIIEVRPQEYLAGLGDLTGELMRMAVMQIGQSDLTSCDVTLELMRNIRCCLEDNVKRLPSLNGKLNVLHSSIKKVEDTRYIYEVRKAEFKDNPEALKRVMEHYEQQSNE